MREAGIRSSDFQPLVEGARALLAKHNRTLTVWADVLSAGNPLPRRALRDAVVQHWAPDLGRVPRGLELVENSIAEKRQGAEAHVVLDRPRNGAGKADDVHHQLVHRQYQQLQLPVVKREGCQGEHVGAQEVQHFGQQ